MHGHLSGKFSESGPDIAMLHPPDGFMMDAGQTVVAAFYVSSFCVQRSLPPLPHPPPDSSSLALLFLSVQPRP